ncbi:MAG: hypothetical protein QM820_35875 [Minicystis sp.]
MPTPDAWIMSAPSVAPHEAWPSGCPPPVLIRSVWCVPGGDFARKALMYVSCWMVFHVHQ